MSTRAELLPADSLLSNAFDPYIFVRDAYLQHRQHLIKENKLDYITYRKQVLSGNDDNFSDADNPNAQSDTLLEP